MHLLYAQPHAAPVVPALVTLPSQWGPDQYRPHREQHGQGERPLLLGPARARVGIWRSGGVTGPTHEESYHSLSAARQAGHKRGHRPGLSLAKASIGILSPLVTNNTRSLWEIQQIAAPGR